MNSNGCCILGLYCLFEMCIRDRSSTEKVKAFVLSHPRALLKAPWSGSGRGIQYVSGSFTIPLEGWIRHILTTQHEGIGEPFYDKLLDFAMEFFAGELSPTRTWPRPFTSGASSVRRRPTSCCPRWLSWASPADGTADAEDGRHH